MAEPTADVSILLSELEEYTKNSPDEEVIFGFGGFFQGQYDLNLVIMVAGKFKSVFTASMEMNLENWTHSLAYSGINNHPNALNRSVRLSITNLLLENKNKK